MQAAAARGARSTTKVVVKIQPLWLQKTNFVLLEHRSRDQIRKKCKKQLGFSREGCDEKNLFLGAENVCRTPENRINKRELRPLQIAGYIFMESNRKGRLGGSFQAQPNKQSNFASQFGLQICPGRIFSVCSVCALACCPRGSRTTPNSKQRWNLKKIAWPVRPFLQRE